VIELNSTHFPVYILLILLITAIVIPLRKGRYDGRFRIEMSIALGLALLLSFILFMDVYRTQAFYYTFGSWDSVIGIQFLVDDFSALMTLIVLFVATLIIIYSLRDIEHEIYQEQLFSYYSLIFLLLFSMIGMIFTNDLFNMYVFMEILSLTSCGIISIKRKKENLLASFKYLMLGAIGSVSILMGIALLYMVTGHLNMLAVRETISTVWQLYPRNILISLGFILTGLGIKAAIFPLHIWLPDAHSNAPTPSSALLSGLVVKVYVFAMGKILFRVIGQDIVKAILVPDYLTYFAATSMIMGSVFAIGQKDIKRLLAYSSVAQIGYIFLGIGLATEMGFSAGLFHVVSHALMKSSLFLSAGAVIYQTGKRDIRDMDGIGYLMPVSMGVFSLAALGMIGVPGINGFMSKWYLSLAVLDAGKPVFLLIILISSFLNSIYYLPIIISAFLRDSKERVNVMVIDNLPKSMMIPMVALSIACLLTGLFPNIIMNIIEKAVPTFIR